MKYTLIAIMFFACHTEKVPNYKIIPGKGRVIWRYTKPGELRKDILTTGDTLCTNPVTGEFYIIKPIKSEL